MTPAGERRSGGMAPAGRGGFPPYSAATVLGLITTDTRVSSFR